MIQQNYSQYGGGIGVGVQQGMPFDSSSQHQFEAQPTHTHQFESASNHPHQFDPLEQGIIQQNYNQYGSGIGVGVQQPMPFDSSAQHQFEAQPTHTHQFESASSHPHQFDPLEQGMQPNFSQYSSGIGTGVQQALPFDSSVQHQFETAFENQSVHSQFDPQQIGKPPLKHQSEADLSFPAPSRNVNTSGQVPDMLS